VYRAGNEARAVIDRYVAEAPANDAVDHPLQPSETLETAGRRFEDVDEDALIAEDLYAKTESASDYCRLVFDAIQFAKGESVADQPFDIPQS